MKRPSLVGFVAQSLAWSASGQKSVQDGWCEPYDGEICLGKGLEAGDMIYVWPGTIESGAHVELLRKDTVVALSLPLSHFVPSFLYSLLPFASCLPPFLPSPPRPSFVPLLIFFVSSFLPSSSFLPWYAAFQDAARKI
jgi:hypothetical protein